MTATVSRGAAVSGALASFVGGMLLMHGIATVRQSDVPNAPAAARQGAVLPAAPEIVENRGPPPVVPKG